jgi:hypothetical protein
MVDLRILLNMDIGISMMVLKDGKEAILKSEMENFIIVDGTLKFVN